MIEITADVVTFELEALVNEKGENFIYEQQVDPESGRAKCVYVHDGEPSCIVGRVLANLGVPLDRLALADAGPGTSADMLLNQLRDEDVITIPDGVQLALQEAQSRQDYRQSWGTAVRSAKNIMEEFK